MIPGKDDMAYTYSVCELMAKKLWNRREVVTIHIGLGSCNSLLDQEGIQLKIKDMNTISKFLLIIADSYPINIIEFLS